jgi:CBS domain-containing protein
MPIGNSGAPIFARGDEYIRLVGAIKIFRQRGLEVGNALILLEGIKMETAKISGELMIPLEKYPHISQWHTIREAIEVMEKAQLEVGSRKSIPRVVLIFDETNQLLGMVRRRDILRALEPQFLASEPMRHRKKLFDVQVDPNLAEVSYEKAIDGLQKRANRLVVDVMRPVAVTVDYDDHIMKVIYEMVDNNLSLLPVLKGGKVVGVVRSVDVLHEVAKILHTKTESNDSAREYIED